MGLRTFRAGDGRNWRVWDSKPADWGSAARGAGISEGWLTFEAVTPHPQGRRATDRLPERRRRAPIPPSWDAGSDESLRRLWAEAIPVVDREAQRAAVEWRKHNPERRQSP